MTEATKNKTIVCVGVLTAIAVICGLLLAILNPLLYVPPSVKDIQNNFSLVEVTDDSEEQWEIKDLNGDYAKGKSSKVLMVAELNHDGNTYVGMTIHTNSDGKLNESTFVMFFSLSEKKLIEAKFIAEGATGGYTYKDFCAPAIGDQNADFSPYLVVIDKENIFGDGKIPAKTGATRTGKSVDHAFSLAANYFYNVYVKGDNQ